MVSRYLTQEECDKREAALVRRVADDVRRADWTRSDYWILPERVQEEIRRQVFGEAKEQHKHPKSDPAGLGIPRLGDPKI
jgi:hypothetical protein